MNAKREQILQAVAKRESIIREVSQQIFSFAEINFQEVKSAAYLINLLRRNGFNVTSPVAGLDTAFIAELTFEEKGPHLGLLVEYDALPQIGHACGHNLIAASNIGAGLALQASKNLLKGKITLFGTPAEEGGGGKVIMAEQGYFDSLDGVVYFHPSIKTDLYGPTLACSIFDVIYKGIPAHVQINPTQGKNALTSLLNLFKAFDELKNETSATTRLGGIITNGGENSIIVPAKTQGEFLISSSDNQALIKLEEIFLQKVNQANEVEATIADTKKKMAYPAVSLTENITETIAQEMKFLGLAPSPPQLLMTSTDCGAVSNQCPFGGFRLDFGPETPAPHTEEFASLCGSKQGEDLAFLAAKILALACLNLMEQSKG